MVIAVLGPTASGKTGLSAELAQEFGGEIVSADSVAVFRGFDIGSAKPDREEREKAVFHLVDIKDPNEKYTVGDFQRDSHAVIDDIIRRGKIPIVSGGSGLYAKTALEGLDNVPQTDSNTREKVASLLKEDYEKCVGILLNADPDAEKYIDLKNPRRLARYLEILFITGKAPTKVFRESIKETRPPFKSFCLTMEREKLIKRINERVDLMVEKGLFRETENLLNNGAKEDCQPMTSIGYKECVAYFQGKMTKDEAIERIKISTRQFAKRQYTWFRKYSSAEWTDTENTEKIKKYIRGYEK